MATSTVPDSTLVLQIPSLHLTSTLTLRIEESARLPESYRLLIDRTVSLECYGDSLSKMHPVFRGSLTWLDQSEEPVLVVAKLATTAERKELLFHEARMYVRHLKDAGDAVPKFWGVYESEGAAVLLLSDCGTALESWPEITWETDSLR